MTIGEHWHVVGIGGVGMYGCAILAHERGHVVTGSDVQASALTSDLVRRGIPVHHTNRPENLADDVDLVVISTVISDENPEVVEARKRGIRVLHRSAALELFTRDRFYIGVLGSAGKGTTAGAITAVLERDGRSPGFYLGWMLRDLGTSARDGHECFVLEIDESDGSMRNFSPDVVVLTNLYDEHLDFYGDRSAMVGDFRNWLEGNRRMRTLVLNADDPGCRALAAELHLPDSTIVWYGFGQHTPENVGAEAGHPYQAALRHAAMDEVRFRMSVPERGDLDIDSPLGLTFNASNLLAAACATIGLGVAPEVVQAALSEYHGLTSRLDTIEVGSAVFVGAYAAVPESVDAVVEHLCTTFGREEVLVVFQPNRSWRLEAFTGAYAASLRKVANVIVTDLAQTWSGQTTRHRLIEQERSGRPATAAPTAASLAAAIGPGARHVPDQEIPAELAEAARTFKVVAVLAGGESYLTAMRDAFTDAVGIVNGEVG